MAEHDGWRNFYSYLDETVSDIQGSPIRYGSTDNAQVWVHTAHDVRDWLRRCYKDFESDGFAKEWAEE